MKDCGQSNRVANLIARPEGPDVQLRQAVLALQPKLVFNEILLNADWLGVCGLE